jgi:hypothetical protein
MTLAIAAAIFVVVLSLVGFVQLLYLESLRLRSRDSEAMEFFKDSLEEIIGYDTEDGAFTFSLLKHTLISLAPPSPRRHLVHRPPGSAFSKAWPSPAVMLFSCYLVPHLLYRAPQPPG